MKVGTILCSFFGRRKLALAFVLMVGILFCQAALAAEAARFEGEDMKHGTFADEPADSSAENGRTLRYKDNGTATYNINLTSAANKIVVRSRNAPASDGSVTINVVIDGVAQTSKRIGSGDAGKTYALRSWPVDLSPGSHTIGVRGGGLRGVDKLLVDNVRLNGPNTLPYTCDKFASPTGNDAGAGTKADPYRTAAKLFSSTAPGKRGCFREGRYQTINYPTSSNPLATNRQTEYIAVGGGTSTARAVYSNYPGEKAEVCAGLRVSNPHVTFEGDTLGGFVLNGTCADDSGKTNQGRHMTRTSPRVWADNVTFSKVDIHKRIQESQPDYLTGVCFLIGRGADPADNVIIEDSAIHHCGVTENGIQPADDPATAPDNHGIYFSNSSKGVTIRNNLIYHNGERGLQMYPNSNNALIHSNILYQNYVNIQFNDSPDNNLVRNNIISEARKGNKHNNNAVGSGSGTDNEVRDNCGWNKDGTSGIMPGRYYTLSGILTADPLLTNPATLAMDMGDASECRSVYPGP